MAVTLYADLNQMEQDAVQEAKILVQKTLPVKPGINEDDVYALFVRDTVDTTNIYPPITNFPLGGVPNDWRPIIVLGCRCQAYKYMETYWVEVPEFANIGVAYANRTQYMQRWKTLYDQFEPFFRKAVAYMKLRHMPGSALLVSTYQPDVLLRGMWEWPRYFRY